MSIFSTIGKRIFSPAMQKTVKLGNIGDSAVKMAETKTLPCAVDAIKMPYADYTQRLLSMKYYNGYAQFARVLEKYSPEQSEIIRKFLQNFSKYGMSEGEVKYFQQEGIKKFELITDKNFVQALLKRKNLIEDASIYKVTKENKNAFIKLLNDENICDEQIKNVAHLVTDKNISILRNILKDKDIDTKILKSLPIEKLNKYNGKALKYIIGIKNIDEKEMLRIMENINKSNYGIAIKLLQRSKDSKGIVQLLYDISSDSTQSGLANRMCKYLYKMAGKKHQAGYFDVIEAHEKKQKLKRKLLSELLDNTSAPFKPNELENYSAILKELTENNYEEIRTALLNKNTNLKELAKSLSGDNLWLKSLLKSGAENSTANYTISEQLTEDQLSFVKKGFDQVQKKYGIKPQGMFFKEEGANDLFLTIKSLDGLKYKFDKTTGKIISVCHQGKTINVAKGTIVRDLLAKEEKIKNMGSSTPYRIDTSIKGEKGKWRTLYTESSIKGQYDIYHTTPDGKVTRIGHALFTPNGAKHIKRTLKSSDGTVTKFLYREDIKGNSHYHSLITDKNGNKLSDIKRTFKVLDDNHFISTKNGQAYDIVFTENEVVVTKLNSSGIKTDETVKYTIKNDVPEDIFDKVFQESAQLAGITEETAKNMSETELKSLLLSKMPEAYKKYGIEQNTIDKKCIEMLKRLPGDEWFAMDKSCKYVMHQNAEKYNAYSSGESIFMSEELKNNLGVFSHELGHAKFNKLNLLNDKKLLEIYNAEKKSYTSKYPESRIQSIDYFLSGNEKELSGLNETCAETNLISNTIQSWDVIQDRTIFLEQYFPKTISYIRQKFNSLG